MARLAICGGVPLRKQRFCWPVAGEEEKRAVLEVVVGGRWGHAMDPECNVTRFEKEYASYYGVKYAVSVNSGSTALEVALRTAGIGPGDEVITPPLTWVATQLAPVMVGADPVFVDVAPENYCMDPEKIEAAITPKTRAIIPVHIGGYLCEMDRIMEIARKHNLLVIEDCAQAHGSRYKDKLAGTVGDFGCFSFEISKLMTAGEGGMVITDHDDWGNYAYSFTNAGKAYGNQGGYPKGKIMGWNLRITEFQAALLRIQLRNLEEQKKKRIENAKYLSGQISEIEGIKPVKQTPDQNYYSYLFKYDPRYFKDVPVQRFREALDAEGIPCFSSVSHQLAYKMFQFCSPRKNYENVSCPVAEQAYYQEAVGIKASGTLLGKKEDMDDIVKAILKIKENAEEIGR